MTARTIAIDGPAGSGKGTAARNLARSLGYAWVDTGAIYRCLAWRAREVGVGWSEEDGLARLARALPVAFLWDGGSLRVHLDGRDVSDAIRTADIGRGASEVSQHPAVRDALLALQRDLAAKGEVVMDGRDIGTVVLPEADLKIYLDASLDERAARRWRERVEDGESVGLEEIRAAIQERDRRDQQRVAAPLRPAEDAVRVDTTDLSPEQVLQTLLDLARHVG